MASIVCKHWQYPSNCATDAVLFINLALSDALDASKETSGLYVRNDSDRWARRHQTISVSYSDLLGARGTLI